MPNKKWTVEFQYKSRADCVDSVFLKNFGPYIKRCGIIFKKDYCFVILEPKLFEEEFYEHIVELESNTIADIISWELNIGLVKRNTYKGNPKRLRIQSSKMIDYKTKYKTLAGNLLSKEKLSILLAYREIKNERSLALRFLMYYRLLECFARNYGGSVDKLIAAHKIDVDFIKEKRNPKKMKSLITHFRNKIHSTKTTYRFPYSALKRGLIDIEKVVREVVENLI